MFRNFRHNVAYYVCEAAFWFDEVFLENLPLDENKWSLSDKVKFRIFNFTYSIGCKLYN